ncbi:MAG TPA: DNA polymerase A family protein, partial [Armatimonadota bacterium]|nr:DNA polymerase A family protein [Armatimonadota bacterium]
TYTEETLEFARENGYVVTPLGRRRYIPEIRSGNRQYRLFAERAAVNMPIQGAAADMMKLAMVSVKKALDESDLKARMVLQVHDELVFEVPPDEVKELAVLVKERMENAYPLAVPVLVEVKVGKNWAEMEPVS